MSKFLEALKNRRSIYAIGDNVTLSNQELTDLIQTAVKESPSAFNSQSSRVVILLDDASKKFWSLTEAALKPLTPADAFENTKQKLASFAAGKGTILFFEDTNVVKGLQEQFALYADNFPIWSEHSTGIAQHSVWVALNEANIGASLQHYNPVVDEAVAKTWDIPANWKLTGQMPFGSIEAPAAEKEYMADKDRFKVFS
ncbi:nitroreductase family protein [Enterococcus lemanii]|jgi:predicted oxidoreductase (fatty acid repression mutant protein)|uniref:Nitroreductase family protein n=1 Tax=Enterococcus lemanii TaxID=1159752 RepID=A0ABV9MZP2_9ENTE|nr:nitroreductase family protein [Enterococcus lemanii]MBM7710193.1 putative oxidoreductase (fatty acid repression mutant protein) [Enterococcus lemanii]